MTLVAVKLSVLSRRNGDLLKDRVFNIFACLCDFHSFYRKITRNKLEFGNFDQIIASNIELNFGMNNAFWLLCAALKIPVTNRLVSKTQQTGTIYEKKSKGFTLIELLVVIAIIGILCKYASSDTSEGQKEGKSHEMFE